MVNMLYSAHLVIFDGEVPPSIKEAILEIQECLNIEDIQILNFDEFNLAIPIDIEINLPSKGTHENIDIRSLESILIVFNDSRVKKFRS